MSNPGIDITKVIDVDLVRPDVDRDLSWICGYHYPEGDPHFPAWCAEARRRGYILVASGEKDLLISELL